MSIIVNHFKLAFRILKKQKLTSWINIFGLGIGLSFFLLLVAYVGDNRQLAGLAAGRSRRPKLAESIRL